MTPDDDALEGEPPGPSGGSLARLVGDVDAFEKRHWGHQTLHISHGRGTFSDVWSVAALDEFLDNTPRRPLVRLVKDGNPISPDRYTRRVRLGGQEVADAVDRSKVVALFDGGATVVSQSLHRTCTSVRRFVADLATEASHPVQANSYLTPPNSTGLATHSDRHDVFVVQVTGSKRWSITGSGETTLVDGDVLYIPAGVEHQAHATDQASLHLTIGLIRTTYRSIVERVLRSGSTDLDFPLPLRYADHPASFVPSLREHVTATVRTLSDIDLDALEQRERARRRPSHRETTSIARSIDQLTLDEHDTIERSGEWTVTSTAEQVLITSRSQSFRAPRVCEQAVHQLDVGTSVKVGELVGLDRQSRVILARRLVAADFCEISRTSNR